MLGGLTFELLLSVIQLTLKIGLVLSQPNDILLLSFELLLELDKYESMLLLAFLELLLERCKILLRLSLLLLNCKQRLLRLRVHIIGDGLCLLIFGCLEFEQVIEAPRLVLVHL